MQSDDTTNDVRIREIANQVFDELKVERKVRRIDWAMPGFGWVDRPFLARHGELWLWPGLQGKLLPEDWRPVLAAALVYQFQFRWKRWAVGFLFLTVWFALVATFFWYYIPFKQNLHVPPCTGRGCGGEYFLAPLAIALLIIFVMAPLIRRLKLQADRRAAQELGIGAELMRVLGKIDEILLSPRPRHRWLTWTPTIPKRLENLARV